jgi:endogenous inhibitor of DNA gyrase (YacG/DUF329 family)
VTRDRTCPVCGGTFRVRKPSQRQRCCSHRCAFVEIGDRVRAAAYTPEARAKGADTRRGSGAADGYVKRGGRHEHRVVAEREAGRPLTADHVVHHRNERKRDNEPANLEITDRAEHARHHHTGRRREPAATCRRGHALTPDNTAIVGSAKRRRCLTCSRAYDRAWKAAKRRKS